MKTGLFKRNTFCYPYPGQELVTEHGIKMAAIHRFIHLTTNRQTLRKLLT